LLICSPELFIHATKDTKKIWWDTFCCKKLPKQFQNEEYIAFFIDENFSSCNLLVIIEFKIQSYINMALYNTKTTTRGSKSRDTIPFWGNELTLSLGALARLSPR